MPLERAVPEEEPEDALRPHRHLGDVQHDPRQGVDTVAVVGTGTAVHVHRHVVCLARSPHRCVALVVERRRFGVVEEDRDRHALQPLGSGTLDLRDREVDVVDRELRDAGASAAGLRAEVGQPPVVREQPRGAQLARVRLAPASGDERAAVREHDLGDDAVVLELLDPALRVPLARGATGDLFGLLVPVVLVERLAREQQAAVFRRLGAPLGELRPLVQRLRVRVEILRLEVRREVVRSADRVTVGRDHHEALHESPPLAQLAA